MTQRLTLTFEQALEGLKAAVADRGEDFSYREAYGYACQNFIDGKAACIAGHVYAQHGIQADEDWSGHSVQYLAGAGEWDDHEPRLIADERTLALLEMAQTEQDCGAPWGVALRAAIDAAESVQ